MFSIIFLLDALSLSLFLYVSLSLKLVGEPIARIWRVYFMINKCMYVTTFMRLSFLKNEWVTKTENLVMVLLNKEKDHPTPCLVGSDLFQLRCFSIDAILRDRVYPYPRPNNPFDEEIGCVQETAIIHLSFYLYFRVSLISA